VYNVEFNAAGDRKVNAVGDKVNAARDSKVNAVWDVEFNATGDKKNNTAGALKINAVLDGKETDPPRYIPHYTIPTPPVFQIQSYLPIHRSISRPTLPHISCSLDLTHCDPPDSTHSARLIRLHISLPPVSTHRDLPDST
jgi:hypothetical protein